MSGRVYYFFDLARTVQMTPSVGAPRAQGLVNEGRSEELLPRLVRDGFI